jgi:hypothetical protein
MENTAVEFDNWMKKIRNEYYSDDDQMSNAYEKLKELANSKNIKHEDNN